MQYLLINKNDTLSSMSKVIGQSNLDLVLAENSLQRTPKIGQAWNERCDQIVQNTPNEVTAARKTTLLNGVVSSEEVFEKVSLLDEDEWKIFSACQAFRDGLRIPESIKVQNSAKIIGANTSVSEVKLGSGGQSQAPVNGVSKDSISTNPDSVDPIKYRAVMKSLQSSSYIDPSIFNTVNTSPAPPTTTRSASIDFKVPQYAFKIPWGKIQLYSSLLDKTIDIPAYPEELDKSRKATYTSMPDIIYQYEPWIVYQNSGPREQEINFHLHRDMWSGNHLDGKATELISFCEANTFPRYSGSAVLAPTVKLYINGCVFISGVMTSTNVKWGGPFGLDDWYLDFNLSLSIQEVATHPLNIDVVSKSGLIGG